MPPAELLTGWMVAGGPDPARGTPLPALRVTPRRRDVAACVASTEPDDAAPAGADGADGDGDSRPATAAAAPSADATVKADAVAEPPHPADAALRRALTARRSSRRSTERVTPRV